MNKNSISRSMHAESGEGVSSPFLDNGILINGVLSYYPESIKMGNDEYIVSQKPQQSFYQSGMRITEAIKIDPSISYGSDVESCFMLYDGNEFSITARDYDAKYPIAKYGDCGNQAFIKYDENFMPTNFEGLPEGCEITHIDVDTGICTLKDNDDNQIIKILDENHNLADLVGLPEGYIIRDISTRDGRATVDNGEISTSYTYNQEVQSVSPIKGLPDNATVSRCEKNGFAVLNVGGIHQELWFYDDDGIKRFKLGLIDGSPNDIYSKKIFVRDEVLGLLRVILYDGNDKKLTNCSTKIFVREGTTNKLTEVDISSVDNGEKWDDIRYTLTPNIFGIDEFNPRRYWYQNNKISPIDLNGFTGKLKVFNNRGTEQFGNPVLELQGDSFSDSMIVVIDNQGKVQKIQKIPQGYTVKSYKQRATKEFDQLIVTLKKEDSSEIRGLLSGDCMNLVWYNGMIVSDIVEKKPKTILLINVYKQLIPYTMNDNEWNDFVKKNGFTTKQVEGVKTKEEIGDTLSGGE